jgi:hypothetical protein
MAYLIESVITMLALAARTQGRLEKIFRRLIQMVRQKLRRPLPACSKRMQINQIKKPPRGTGREWLFD